MSPTTGTVRVLGADPAALSGRDRRRLRARVGTVHQSLELVGRLRVVHDVNAGRLASWSAARAAWSLVRPQGLPEVLAALARVGLAEGGVVLGRPVATLSDADLAELYGTSA